MIKTIKRKQILMAVIGLILILLSFCLSNAIVYAEENPTLKFEELNLIDELNSIDGFKWSDYPYNVSDNENVKPQIFNVVEYCYSIYADKRTNYGLYLYFYNPRNTNFDTSSKQNTVTLGVKYDGGINKGKPTLYEKFDLKFISKVESGNYANLFYKFKVVDHKSKHDDKKIEERVNSAERKYDISEFELLEKDQQLAKSYTIGASYTFTGYAKGYEPDTDVESNLRWEVEKIETIEITGEDIGHSSYVMPTNNENGINHYDQIHSVYFSVPNEIYEKYGNLQKVMFKTYEYKTKPIIVTKDSELADWLKSRRGINDNLSEKLTYALIANRSPSGATEWPDYADWIYGIGKNTYYICGSDGISFKYSPEVTHLPYVFYKDFGDKSYDVTAQELLDYIYSYNFSNFGGYIEHKNLTSDLFTTKEPLNADNLVTEIDAGELKNLTQYDLSNFFDKLWNKLFGKLPAGIPKNLKPIQELNMNLSSYDIDDLFICSYDSTEFNNKMQIAKNKNRKMNCFRFAVTEYSTQKIENIKNAGIDIMHNKSYAAQQTVFLDFDIIQLTFMQEGVMTIIPVTMSPLDIVGGLWSPDKTIPDDLLGKLFALILGIIGVLLLLPLIFWGVKLLIALLTPRRSTAHGAVKVKVNDTSKKGSKHNDNKYNEESVEIARKRFNKKE